jgi:hypothetical protein
MRKLSLLVALLAICAGCGSSSSPAAPSSPATSTPAAATPAPAPTPVTPATFSLSGTISFTGLGSGIPSASVTIVDGANAGKTVQTNSAGAYSFSGLTGGGFTVSITASGFVGVTRPVTLTANTTLSVSLLPSQLFTQSGVGDNVFTIPAYVTKVRIDGSYQGSCQNFIVKAGTSLLVNVIIGTCSVADTHSPFSGTYAIAAGAQIAITSSTGIAWTFTEVRS